MLTQQALNQFVECTSGLVGGEGLSITFKLGLKRSIEHIRFARTTVIIIRTTVIIIKPAPPTYAKDQVVPSTRHAFAQTAGAPMTLHLTDALERLKFGMPD